MNYPKENYALLTDLYQLTMMQGYYLNRVSHHTVFDMFFRRPPFGAGYAVFAGLQPFVNALLQFKFSEEDIAYLSSLDLFRDEFLDYLKSFQFSGDIYSVAEGELVFPNEPLMRVHAPVIEAQLIETFLLNTVNFQTLIATKTARITEAAQGKKVMEFGLRRAQGADGALSASRAAFIGGAGVSSNVLAGKRFGIPVSGTMAHSWVMLYGDEKEAFTKYAEIYPEHTILLVDTYDTLKKGMPAAIEVLQSLKKRGISQTGIRIDSGDLDFLSRESRKMLDEAGLSETRIIVSNELDEHIVDELLRNGAPIDGFGVGTNLITAKDDPALTGVYKLSARINQDKIEPCLKVSNNPEKTTLPGIKNVLRFKDKKGEMIGDMVVLEEEKKELEDLKSHCLIHPRNPYENFEIKQFGSADFLLKKVVDGGKKVIDFPPLSEVQKFFKTNLSALHYSHKRLLNPHIYKVGLSSKLSQLRLRLIEEYKSSLS